MLTIKDPDKVYEWDLTTLWEILNTLEKEELQEYEEEYYKIKFGYNVMVPISYLTENYYEDYPTTKKVKVLGYGKYNFQDFYDELDERKHAMRQIILDNIRDEDKIIPRT